MIFSTIRVPKKHFYKITIPELFKQSPPRPQKLITKAVRFLETGELEKIYVDRNYCLVDGYCSYLIAETVGVKKAKGLRIVMLRGESDNNG